MSAKDRRAGSDGNTCLVIPVEEFWERKVDWFTQCWWNERHTDDQYVYNMKHMGFDEPTIRNNMYEES
jgi:hypothetical protein|tara:strand:+ start:325 stop:528 length:204 start_codon:yes stop_codon:yes gene_type:complete